MVITINIMDGITIDIMDGMVITINIMDRMVKAMSKLVIKPRRKAKPQAELT